MPQSKRGRQSSVGMRSTSLVLPSLNQIRKEEEDEVKGGKKGKEGRGGWGKEKKGRRKGRRKKGGRNEGRE